VLCSLTRAEVGALAEGAFEAVRARLAELGPSGRHAARLAQAAAASGRAPLAQVLAAFGAATAEPGTGDASAEAQPQKGQHAEKAVAGGAACQAAWDALQPLAWGIHSRGAAGVREALAAALSGSAAAYASEAAAVIAASVVVNDVRTAFALEAELAWSDAVARPDRILSGGGPPQGGGRRQGGAGLWLVRPARRPLHLLGMQPPRPQGSW
jgi:hypothetical protein